MDCTGCGYKINFNLKNKRRWSNSGVFLQLNFSKFSGVFRAKKTIHPGVLPFLESSGVFPRKLCEELYFLIEYIDSTRKSKG